MRVGKASFARSDHASSKRWVSQGSGKNINSSAKQEGNKSHRNQRKPFVTPYEIENELQEIQSSDFDRSNLQVNVILDLQYPDLSQEPENMFESAEYWLSKGLQAQTYQSPLQVIQATQMDPSERKRPNQAFKTHKQELEACDQALDFYFQGLRLDPFHFGCCFNVGVTYLQKGMNLNAQKWFAFARMIDIDRKEPYLGEAISSFKVGQILRCLQSVRSRPGQATKYNRFRKQSVDDHMLMSEDSDQLRHSMSGQTQNDEGRQSIS